MRVIRKIGATGAIPSANTMKIRVGYDIGSEMQPTRNVMSELECDLEAEKEFAEKFNKFCRRAPTGEQVKYAIMSDTPTKTPSRVGNTKRAAASAATGDGKQDGGSKTRKTAVQSESVDDVVRGLDLADEEDDEDEHDDGAVAASKPAAPAPNKVSRERL